MFGNFIPSVLNVIKSIPVVGPALTPLIESQAFSQAIDFIAKSDFILSPHSYLLVYLFSLFALDFDEATIPSMN